MVDGEGGSWAGTRVRQARGPGCKIEAGVRSQGRARAFLYFEFWAPRLPHPRPDPEARRGRRGEEEKFYPS